MNYGKFIRLLDIVQYIDTYVYNDAQITAIRAKYCSIVY